MSPGGAVALAEEELRTTTRTVFTSTARVRTAEGDAGGSSTSIVEEISLGGGWNLWGPMGNS